MLSNIDFLMSKIIMILYRREYRKNSVGSTLESSFCRLGILHILWYHKIDVSILKITFTLWYHMYDFLIPHKWFCDITKSARIFLYQKIDFMISKNRICDITKWWRFFGIIFLYITKSIFYTKKSGLFFLISHNRFCDIKNRFGYIKFDFVISQNGGFIVHTDLLQDFINNNL